MEIDFDKLWEQKLIEYPIEIQNISKEKFVNHYKEKIEWVLDEDDVFFELIDEE